jgi:secondary thiamine-phosphate synthase enzyme
MKSVAGVVRMWGLKAERRFRMQYSRYRMQEKTTEVHMIRQLRVKTNARTELVDITQVIQRLVAESGIRSGVCYIYVPHTTSAITINENSDPNVGRDILKELNKVIPFDDNYGHNEGNSAAHIKSTIVGVSKAVIVEDSRLALGTWQAVFFCEFDGPRDRRVMVKVMKD